MKTQNRDADRAGKMLGQFEAVCRREGLPLTVQRRAVLEALAVRHDHPTADALYDEVKERVPGISRATVYRVLEALVRAGVARRASHHGAAARFDPNTDRHHHLACTRCDRVVDLEDGALDALPLPDARRTGFHVTDYSIHFSGVCDACRREAAAKNKEKEKRR